VNKIGLDETRRTATEQMFRFTLRLGSWCNANELELDLLQSDQYLTSLAPNRPDIILDNCALLLTVNNTTDLWTLLLFKFILIPR
jgi:hypothetical protein